METHALRGSLLSFSGLPSEGEDHVQYFPDGVLTIKGDRIATVTSAEAFQAAGGNLAQVEDLRPALVIPGMIDAHVHCSQLGIVASFGTQLLDWLDNYAFPAEMAFADRDHAAAEAERFFDLLFAHGTTTALTFTTVHAGTTDALFSAARARNARVVAGKVLMNRNAPEELTEKTTGAESSAELIERWHGVGRGLYAVTPRFAITSTPDQLTAAGELLRRYPGTYLHTHVAENPAEIAYTLELFPEARSYVDVYHRAGLVTERSFFAHGIHLSDDELKSLRAGGSSVVFCPSSNLFLGSGLLDLERLKGAGVRLGFGTDVGGGPSLSPLQALADGYKVLQLQGQSWAPLDMLHAVTLGNAEALGLADCIGRLAPGFDADVTVLSAKGHGAVAERLGRATSLRDTVFGYVMLGDDRSVARTYVGDASFTGVPLPDGSDVSGMG